MSKKPGRIGDKTARIGGVKSTDQTQEVNKAAAIAEVNRVAKTAAVSRMAGQTGITSGGGRRLSAGDRDEIFRLISEEAEKVFAKSGIAPQQRQVIEDAVKMALDAAMLEEEDVKE